MTYQIRQPQRARMQSSARKRLAAVTSALLSEQPFFGQLALRLTPVEDTSRETIASDGDALRYDPKWVDEAPADQLKTAIARIVSALTLKHHTRRGEREYATWQQASQDVTHALLAASGFRLPNDASTDPRLDGMTVEQRYDELREQQGNDSDNSEDENDAEPGTDNESTTARAGSDSADEGRAGSAGSDGTPGGGESRGAEDPGDGDEVRDDSGRDQDDRGDGSGASGTSDGALASGHGVGDGESDPQPASCDPCGTGEVLDAPCASDDERDEEERAWDEAATQAGQVAKAEGKLPGNVGELLDDWHRTETPWKEFLADFCDEATDDDYAWHPGDRRQIHDGLYLPDVSSEEALPPFVLMVDTSGSIASDPTLWRRFWSETRTIFEDLSPERVIVIQFDARVQRVDEFDGHDLPDQLQIVGGGGTDFRAPFAHLAQLDEPPPFVLVFTDMLCHTYPDDPGVPTLWCNYERAIETEWTTFAVPAFGTRLDVVDIDQPGRAAA